MATYSAAFVVGVVQFMALENHADWVSVRTYFTHLLARNYGGVRPQFLFAEPSYIGMHLFGVLLPVQWVTHDHRLAVLIPVFTVGSILMGSGTRIVIDAVVAGVLWLVVAINFKRVGQSIASIAGIAAVTAGGVAALSFNPRLNKLATDGLLRGDDSMSARIFHMLAPAWAWRHDTWHALFGWGAGNISVAVRNGYQGAREWYEVRGGLVNPEIEGLSNPPADTFTMSAYVSFITEFGMLAFFAFVLLVIFGITRSEAWSRRTVCWLLLVAYLYVQFEAYAFYAVWLLIWVSVAKPVSAISNRSHGNKDQVVD